jgi:CPA2 family monovalent cation:H+ antiporter-2
MVSARLGYSVALGAFLAGSLVAESGEEEAVARLVAPVRDVFAAIFFVSVGMSIDPLLVIEHASAIAVLLAVVIIGNVTSVTVGAFLAGQGVRTSVQAGMSLAQLGEFSFILAGLGVTLGATREFLYAVAVALSAFTTLATPWMIRYSGPVASAFDRALPPRLQTYAALYGSWVDRMRRSPRASPERTGLRRLAPLLGLDAALLGAVGIGASLYAGPAAALLRDRFGASDLVARALVLAGVAALVVPLLVGVFRLSGSVAVTLGEAAFPRVAEGTLDRAFAPRRALVATLQLAVVLVVGVPLVALTQPFLTGAQGAVVLALVLASLAIAFWRRAAELHGHVKAGAEVILETLARQTRRGHTAERDLERVTALVPGLGEPVPVRLDERCGAIGRTLADIDLRGQTGATVLAISRGRGGVIVPSARDVLEVGDVLALAGTHEDVAAARKLLLAPPAPAEAS